MARDDRVDVPRADISREFERAEQMFQDARTASSVDISKATIVNRLYYACFHAAQAALYARGLNPRSHGQVGTMLGYEFVQSGELNRDLGRFFNDMQIYRHRVDYGSGGVERPTDDLIAETATFVEAMRGVGDVDEEGVRS